MSSMPSIRAAQTPAKKCSYCGNILDVEFDHYDEGHCMTCSDIAGEDYYDDLQMIEDDQNE